MITAGSRVGPYEIVAPLGAGGMGEVYRARDPRIGREVAVKVLPSALANNPDRLRRFEQEARAAGMLNHPNLLAIYDLGTTDGAPYIVSELLEGETLRARIGGAPLSPRRAIEYAVQIATGLAAAHERGITHRDLKPENLFVAKDGRVKILDFGLAKLTAPAESSLSDATAKKETDPGTVMGTVGYMSPEQVRGHEVDHRSDIFSFGAVLYEMLTGRRAFQGPSNADTMSAILREDPPDVTTTNPHVPPGLERIVRHCLEKNPEQRFQSARDLAFDLETLSQSGSSAAISGGRASLDARRPFLIPALALALVAIVAALYFAGFRITRTRASSGASLQRRFVQLTSLEGAERYPTISPDGTSFAYVGESSGNPDIFFRRIDGRNALNLTKQCGERDFQPAFSPDGTQIAFRSECDGGGIFLIGATGESLRRLTDFGYNPAWSPDGKWIVCATESIAFSPRSRSTVSALWIVEVASGSRRQLKTEDAVQPSWSPDGQRIAFWRVAGNSGQRDLFTIAVDGTSPAVSVTNDAALDWNPVWSPDGRWLYFGSDRDGTLNLWRIAIDSKTGRTSGEPQPIGVPASFAAHVSISRDGKRLLYASNENNDSLRRVAIDPRSGQSLGDPQTVIAGSPIVGGFYPNPAGDWVAVTMANGPQEDLFIIKTDGSEVRQLTNDIDKDRGPGWSGDGKSVYFYSSRGSGDYEIWKINIDGSGLAKMTETDNAPWFPRPSPDGTRLSWYNEENSYIAPLTASRAGKGEPLPMMDDAHIFRATSWSPDGSRILGMRVRAVDGFIEPGLYVYSVGTRSYASVSETATGNPIANAWIDVRQVIAWNKGKFSIIDVDTKKERPLETPFSAVLAYAVRNGYLYVRTTSTAGDIWMAELTEREE